jgi:AcrR family transcriptional regulator
MGRPGLHSADAILDAAGAVVVEQGVRAATIGAIAKASEASTGSIYHRFGSLQELLARMWIRAVRRSQAWTGLGSPSTDAVRTVVIAALGTYDFCANRPADANLLSLFRREDFLSADLPRELHDEVDEINAAALAAARDVAAELFATRRGAGVDLVLAAAVDLPYGLARPYLQARRQPPSARRARIPAAVRALVSDDPG